MKIISFNINSRSHAADAMEAHSLLLEFLQRGNPNHSY